MMMMMLPAQADVKTLLFGGGHFVLQILHRNFSSEGQSQNKENVKNT